MLTTMMKFAWSSMIFIVLLFASVTVHVCAYKILMIPVLSRSHVFQTLAIAEGLVNGGHNVSLFVGEGYSLNLPPELTDRPEFSVVRYRDCPAGIRCDYEATTEKNTRAMVEADSSAVHAAMAFSSRY